MTSGYRWYKTWKLKKSHRLQKPSASMLREITAICRNGRGS